MPSRGKSQSTKTSRGRKTGTQPSGPGGLEEAPLDVRSGKRTLANKHKTLPKRSRAKARANARMGMPVSGGEGSRRRRTRTMPDAEVAPGGKETTSPRDVRPRAPRSTVGGKPRAQRSKPRTAASTRSGSRPRKRATSRA